ncbi:unnamed protein product [Cylindrotheca closterium]|uniref:Uncharacterized protein n=1 Tax=Cylindrotheca closterium TaxID=2856 RepID=A0AAD2CCI2_9STRA|nr:unnamed protein product [Cylindrotheca closterium]
MNQHAGVRFTLKKRTIRKSLDDVKISSYNSDFLSGLFADVAKITEMADSGSTKRSCPEPATTVAEQNTNLESPTKKRRTLLSSSVSRCNCSSYNLSDLATSHSTKAVIEESREVFLPSPTQPRFLANSIERNPLATVTQSGRQDSLAYQLDCVSGPECPKLSTENAAVVAFPNLPATVSDSSCAAGLTRGSQIKQGSSPEKQPYKESFGWFVDLDDHQRNEGHTVSSYSVFCPDLAFQAPTAPNATHNDAAVQWAKAADTVDDVLGDFF